LAVETCDERQIPMGLAPPVAPKLDQIIERIVIQDPTPV
jgi:hypothetical protein